MNNFRRIIKISVGEASFTNEELEIRFEAPFDDDIQPNQSKVQIYNLSKSTLSRLRKGQNATIQAGYEGDIGVLSSGVVSKIVTKWEGLDKITSIYFIEGEDFTRIKVTNSTTNKKGSLSIGFKEGSDGLTIIKRLVSVLGIKLGAPITLKKNVIYKKGYIVTQLIMNNLEEVVRDCGSIMYHRRGKLVIRPVDIGTDEKFTLEENTGLIGSPSEFEITDKKGSEDKAVRGYTVKCLLQHRISTCSVLKIKSKSANGQYRAFKGKHIADADDFYTEFECV
ncbi:phage protein [Fictibacillus sp. JL2B1089]|uniref:phage protein n=1 Tax=Fictibacillus sp. JL2B1089 TaxID=3399565 RepID=UPI003A8C4025